MMREPDLQGPGGRAYRRKLEGPLSAVTVASWLVNQPQVHAFWSWWLVSVISLRQHPNFPRAHLQYPEAEYEFSTWAVDPRSAPAPDPDSESLPVFGRPDVCVQFHGVSATRAVEICELAVRSMVAGGLAADSDFRTEWERRIRATVQCIREGRHDLN